MESGVAACGFVAETGDCVVICFPFPHRFPLTYLRPAPRPFMCRSCPLFYFYVRACPLV